jgi:hypothetical protein
MRNPLPAITTSDTIKTRVARASNDPVLRALACVLLGFVLGRV